MVKPTKLYLNVKENKFILYYRSDYFLDVLKNV